MQGKLVYQSEKIPGVKAYANFRSRDERGVLVKVLEPEFLGDAGKFGEIYFITVKTGGERANHFHKKATEYFSILKGVGKLALWCKGFREEFILDEKEPMLIVVPPEVCHSITGVSKEDALLLAYSDISYSADNSDTYPASLLKDK